VTGVTPAAAGEALVIPELREARGESGPLEAGEDGEVGALVDEVGPSHQGRGTAGAARRRGVLLWLVLLPTLSNRCPCWPVPVLLLLLAAAARMERAAFLCAHATG
jgi:hypothetical protein